MTVDVNIYSASHGTWSVFVYLTHSRQIQAESKQNPIFFIPTFSLMYGAK